MDVGGDNVVTNNNGAHSGHTHTTTHDPLAEPPGNIVKVG